MASATGWLPLRDRLAHELETWGAGLKRIVGSVPVEYHPDPPGLLLVSVAKHRFNEPTDDVIRQQLEVKRAYEAWIEVIRIVFHHAPSDVESDIQAADTMARKWIELENNYSISEDATRNVAALTTELSQFNDLLSLLPRDVNPDIILVPDTNVLVATPDPKAYTAIAQTSTFSFFLLPTVIREMDNLKHTARDQPYRAKVSSAITRIKGWRGQGRLTDGVTVDKTIRVKAFAKEPDFSTTLHWLDRTNQDDRVVAAALEIQVEYPAAIVVIVTSDLNLQNKAEVARLPYAESP